MADAARLQVKSTLDPEKWEDVGAGAVGVPVPVTIEGGITIGAADIEIGAVEIKNATDDTRATVGANGLYTEVRAIAAGDNNIGNVDVASIAAGDNNIGNVDIASSLPAGSNNIGDVDVLSVIPGTGATNLGKARGSARGTTDTGVAMLGVYEDSDALTTVDDGDYANLSMTHFKELRTRDQRSIDLANCNVYTDYTVLGNDTVNLANSTNHVFGSGAITFDKANGAANTVYAGVYKTFTAVSYAEIFEAGGFVGLSVYFPSLTNVVNVFLRVGTDASNYNCWTWDVVDITAATWMNLRKSAAQPNYAKNAGNGWNTSAVSYVAFGVEFANEANALTGITFDHVHIVGGRITASDISTAVSSTVTTPNVNINRVGGVATATGNGVTTAGTLRVALASDSSAAKTDHNITGIAHGIKTVTTAGTDEALAGSTVCKRVIIQAQTDNTGWIAVGTTGVDATVATGTGVLLGAGDAMEIEIDNLADIYIDSTVNGDGVRYTYFT